MTWRWPEDSSRQEQEKVTVTCQSCGTDFKIDKWLKEKASRLKWRKGPYCATCRRDSFAQGGSGKIYIDS